jgi:hypothetical protein
MRRGGRVLAPGHPGRAIQPVDARDLAAFALGQLERGAHGQFNVAAPEGRETYGGLLDACLHAVHGTASFVWADEQWLAEQGVRQWTELPLWRIPGGTWAMDATRAASQGLTCRSLFETVADTWSWLNGGGAPVDHERRSEHGIEPDKERMLLAAWDARSAA